MFIWALHSQASTLVNRFLLLFSGSVATVQLWSVPTLLKSCKHHVKKMTLFIQTHLVLNDYTDFSEHIKLKHIRMNTNTQKLCFCTSYSSLKPRFWSQLMELKCIGNNFRGIDLGGKNIKKLSKQTFHINLICVNKKICSESYLLILITGHLGLIRGFKLAKNTGTEQLHKWWTNLYRKYTNTVIDRWS